MTTPRSPSTVAEELLLKRWAGDGRESAIPVLFILGSPRTGSTLVYQLIARLFDVFYFSNFINDHFATTPVVGAAIEKQLGPHEPLVLHNAYGKTDFPYGPSEGSAVFQHWFGGDHPSQLRSIAPLPGKSVHLQATITGLGAMTGRLVVAKNAWNCFRIESLASLFPNAHFLWVRRDLVASAVSDLESRYRRGGPTTWNSATTHNVAAIQQRPYWEQVVEQQYEYNVAIGKQLMAHAPTRHLSCWYEAVCADLPQFRQSLVNYLDSHQIVCHHHTDDQPVLELAREHGELASDREKIESYVRRNAERLEPFGYHTLTGEQPNAHDGF